MHFWWECCSPPHHGLLPPPIPPPPIVNTQPSRPTPELHHIPPPCPQSPRSQHCPSGALLTAHPLNILLALPVLGRTFLCEILHPQKVNLLLGLALRRSGAVFLGSGAVCCAPYCPASSCPEMRVSEMRTVAGRCVWPGPRGAVRSIAIPTLFYTSCWCFDDWMCSYGTCIVENIAFRACP